jgi:hypothetical protein
VKDTRLEIEQKYRELLLARSGEERLRIGCSMHATAQALVRASVLARDPLASPPELRSALFLRFYGQEFGVADRERIMARLGRAPTEGPETSRRVPVNWGDLEKALTSNVDEWACYLDVRNGGVQMAPIDSYGDSDDRPSAEDVDAELAAGHLIPIEPLGSSIEYGWMTEFAESVADARVRARLEMALDGRGAFRRFKIGGCRSLGPGNSWSRLMEPRCWSSSFGERRAGFDVEETTVSELRPPPTGREPTGRGSSRGPELSWGNIVSRQPAAANGHQSGTGPDTGMSGSTSQPRVTTRPSRRASCAAPPTDTILSTPLSGRAGVSAMRPLTGLHLDREDAVGAWRTISTSRPACVRKEWSDGGSGCHDNQRSRFVEKGGLERGRRSERRLLGETHAGSVPWSLALLTRRAVTVGRSGSRE